MSKRLLIHFLSPLVLTIAASPAFGQSAAFSYQGRLTTAGNPATGLYEMQFRLFDTVDVGTGTQQGATVTNNAVQVTSGVFTVQLDFGATVFTGPARFLEIGVRTAGNPNPFTILSPRQPITSTPYAVKSLNATTADGLSVACVNCITSSQISSVSASALTGTLPVSSIPAGSANYIQNTTSQQASANFNISGNGTVGGTLSANNLLTYPTSGNGGLRIRNRTNGNVAQVVLADDTDTYRGYLGYIGANAGLGGRNDTIEFGTNGKHLTFRPNETEVMRLTTSGNVGIGLPVPAFKLDVGDRMRVNNGASGSAGIWFHQFTGFGSFEQAFVGMQDTANVGFFGNTGAGWSLTVNTTSGLVSARGVSSTSTSGTGVLGSSATGVGVYGLSLNGNDGVVGESRVANRSGVYGFTTHANGCGGCFENRGGGIALGVTGIAKVDILQIAGGSDLAEHFEVAEGGKPGMVVAIDPQNTGKLAIARGAYNRRAAGVISGAGNLSAGLVLPDVAGAKTSMPVALSGRVWVYCDAARNPIRPGDLLTTSLTPGHAMKVTNYARAQGAIIGKAMTGLKSGRGLVLVLVSLQ